MPIRKLTGIPKMNVYVINRKNYLLDRKSTRLNSSHT